MSIHLASDVEQLLPSCEGLVRPAPPGTPIDALRSVSVLRRADRVRRSAELAADRYAGDVARTARVVSDGLSGRDPLIAYTAFDTPWASWDEPSAQMGLEAVEDPRDAQTRSLALARHLLGVPGLALTLVLPAAAFTWGSVRLPHLGVTIKADAAVVAETESSGTTVLTWDDGIRATLPVGGPPALAEDGALLGSRLRLAPRWGSLPVEPSTMDVAAAFAGFEPAFDASAADVCRAGADGLDLLRAVWPIAGDSAARWLAGWMPLQPRPGTRSHTSPRLTGVVLSSAVDAVTAGDVLCHELAHLRLMTLLEYDRLLENGGEQGHRSPWRDDPRPLLGVLLGVHAFLDVCDYHRRLVESGANPDSEGIYARQADKVRRGWAILREAAVPTVVGSRVLGDLGSAVEAL